MTTTTGSYSLTGNASWLQWEAWLSEISYKPGWEFRLFDGPTVQIAAAVLDSRPPHEPTRIVHTIALCLHPSDMDRDRFMHAVLRAVIQVETHEAMEFCRAAGERVRNPHEKGQVRYAW